MSMDIESPEFEIIRAPSTSVSKRGKKRVRPRLINQEELSPIVSKKKRAPKKRGSSVRVTIRKQLKAKRKILRRNFFAMKRQYRIKKARLDRDINSLIVRKAQPK